MPDPNNLPLQTALKYNPHLWSEDELRAVFVARGRELQAILDPIHATEPDLVPQHLLITGYRGMGKTTLLRRIGVAVADDTELESQWIALTFPEEQYTVSTLAELWMNVLDSLADTLERESASPDALARLDGDIQALLALDPGKREAAALTLLQSWVAECQRRILLLIDSSDLLFAALARTFGAGKGLRGEAAEQEMQRGLDARPERLKSLRALTGGNPRTTVILYELFAAGWQGSVHSDLKALLDLMTPLYKARMEHLAEQPRKLLAHLAARRLADRSRQSLTEVLPDLFDGRQSQQPLVTADDYLRRFRALDAKLARCSHGPSEEIQDWIEAVKGSLSLKLEEKEQIAEAAAELTKKQYEGLHQAFGDEDAGWGEHVSENVYLQVRAAVLSGDFFPDGPDSRLAYQQILSAFADAPEALDFAVNMVATLHQDEWTERLYRKVIEINPKFASPWIGLGNLLQDHLGRYMEAEAAYRQAMASNPQDLYPTANLARLLAGRGDKDEADTLYRRVAGRAADSGNAAFDGFPAEIRGMAEESLADILR